MIAENALADFTGGFAAQRASTAFGDGQWASLRGFVIEDGARLRSQWPRQHIGGPGDLQSLGVYEGHSGTIYLVGVRASGEIVWRPAPPDDAQQGSIGSVWNTLQNDDGSTPTDQGGEQYRRPTATFPLRQQNQAGYRSGLLLNSVELSHNTSSVLVYENEAGTELWFIEETNHWPQDEDDGGLPLGEQAALWNGVLVLGDVVWINDPESDFSDANSARHSNALFFSNVGDPFAWDLLNVAFIGDSHVAITGLQPIDSGLLVFTTSSPSGNGGVYLLRGTPPDRFAMDPLRLGTGADTSQTYWQYTGTAAWVTEHGQVWQTDGAEVVRLDWQGLGVDPQPYDTDGCVEFGPWLMVSRGGRLFALRMIDEHSEAAWTEIADPPEGLDMRSAHVSGQSLYLLANGEVYRYTRAHMEPSMRGSVDGGTWPDLQVSTATLETGEGHDRTFWRGAGIRATAGSDDVEQSQVVGAELHAGPALDTAADSLSVALNKPLSATAGARRLQARVRGPGPATELAVTFRLRGDVRVEQVSVFYTPGARASQEDRR